LRFSAPVQERSTYLASIFGRFDLGEILLTHIVFDGGDARTTARLIWNINTQSAMSGEKASLGANNQIRTAQNVN
jgi:hypothetical protein